MPNELELENIFEGENADLMKVLQSPVSQIAIASFHFACFVWKNQNVVQFLKESGTFSLISVSTSTGSSGQSVTVDKLTMAWWMLKIKRN